MRALGVHIEQPDTTTLIVTGGTLRQPTEPLNLANAGTGFRLLAGILAGQPFASTLDGSPQLRRRPMRRITEPLRQMGANVTDHDGLPPLYFQPTQLHGIYYDMPVASGQVKSALLLASLFADGPTTVTQPGPARDHTERLLHAMGADIQTHGNRVTLRPGHPLHTFDLTVPGDFSSAAFLLVAASIMPDSHLVLENISINSTRTGLIEVLQAMNAHISVTQTGRSGGDPVGQIVVQSTALQAVTISGETVVRMIDEFPALMVAALFTNGTTVVRDAQELRVKETDRLAVMTQELRKMGAVIEEYQDGFSITGPQQLQGTVVDGHDDHRIAMSLAVTGLVANGITTVCDAGCIADSFPGFAATLKHLGADME
jgi:3-phosphoshikimate 1-carboxyvinyltransferase